ncbi:SH3 domain-containing protein [Pseudomonas carnis]|uniref:SH3 domain-containing protein n=1 Tax=Pseudomonas carnis TaxID=2487355 RepID=UPI001D89B6AA|nr:SH3 domain-containing protein [Pseudomonas carnis]CAH0225842.1 hypothetical protein SRABI08_02487 [Pseudomonas carnis]
MSDEETCPPDGQKKASFTLGSNADDLLNSAPLAKIVRSWEEGPAAKAMAAMAASAKTWEEGPAAKAMAAMAASAKTWEEGPAAKAMAAMAASARAWEEGPAAKAMAAMAASARTWEEGPAAKALAAMAASTRTWEEGPAAKAMAAMAASTRTWEEGAVAKALSAASITWGEHSAFRAAVSAVRSLDAFSAMRELAEPTVTLSRWGVSGAITVDAVLEELASRTDITVKQSAENLYELLQKSEPQSNPGWADVAQVGEAKTSAPVQSLNAIPTYALLFWLYVVAPLVYVMVNWESARIGLADLNARLPQTELLSEIRNFIRTEIAGKPADVRLVKGENVRLRAGPGMKTDVILLLPPDAIVVVLGKEDRTWLYVSYEHQGYMVDGYLSTQFLKKIRK